MARGMDWKNADARHTASTATRRQVELYDAANAILKADRENKLKRQEARMAGRLRKRRVRRAIRRQMKASRQA